MRAPIAVANIALALAVAGLALTASGCTERTDCKVMEKRFSSCSEQLWKALEPHGTGGKAWRASKNARHFKYCQRIKGRYKQSKAINECLDKKSCAEFSSCFCRAVKKNKKECPKSG